MPDKTKNYQFKKPKENEYISPNDFNDNWDIADTMIKQMENVMKTVTINVDLWTDCTAAVSIADVKVDSIVIVSPAPESIDDYTKAKIKCCSQAAGKLTFMCSDTPLVNIKVNIVIMGR